MPARRREAREIARGAPFHNSLPVKRQSAARIMFLTIG